MLTNHLLSALDRRGYEIYTRPGELNLVGIRNRQARSNAFDDEFYVLYVNDQRRWERLQFACTTDPGTYWLDNPGNPQGTALLKAGQYKGAYQIGTHAGKYTALVQTGAPVTVLRQYNRNPTVKWSNGLEDTGYFGINIHRALLEGTAYRVDKFSAGCQVLQHAPQFTRLMELAQIHRLRYGNWFTYTLFDYRTARRSQLAKVKAAAGIALSATLIYKGYGYYHRNASRQQRPARIEPTIS